jgi:hypothetical protein
MHLDFLDVFIHFLTLNNVTGERRTGAQTPSDDFERINTTKP